MSELVDSGDRTQFSTGAVRDLGDDKGRCDLMPLSEMSSAFDCDKTLCTIMNELDNFIKSGNSFHIHQAVKTFVSSVYDNTYDAMLDMSYHYKDGAEKYGERNWEAGIPISSYLNSGIRHFIQYYRGDDDEHHERSAIWNMLGLLYTLNNHSSNPELMNIPSVQK